MPSRDSIASSEPKFLPISEEEKSRNAWWFRQIATTLALGNAGGIVAISGFAANIDNINLGMVVSFPAISFFFAGVFYAAISFVVQFIYSFTRMEAIAEHVEKLNEWRANNGKPKKIGGWSTLFFFLYVVAITFTLGYSAFYFYRGAASVSHATAAIACLNDAVKSKCNSDGAWLFVAPPADVRERVKTALTNRDPKEEAATCNVAFIASVDSTPRACKP